MLNVTNVFKRNVMALNRGKTLLINYGGSRSSKTYSVIQLLNLLCQTRPDIFVIMISSTYPKLKNTVRKDFMEICDYMPERFNNMDGIYSYPNGAKVKFMSADMPENFTGVKSDYVLIDELNTIRQGREVFMQLETRNSKAIFVTFNPAAKFWITDFWDEARTKIIHSTYKDNIQNLPPKIVKGLEERINTDETFYRVYTLGEWGYLEGLVFKEFEHWQITDFWPEHPKWTIFGLDFGFTNHETALTELSYFDQVVYVRQHIYETHLTNADIANIVKEKGIRGMIIADSAEPKSIEELWRLGLNIEGARKGPDSLRNGIDLMKSTYWAIHRSATEVITELRNYSYKTTKTGEALNTPIDDWDHAIDSIRYAYSYKVGGKGQGVRAYGVARN